MDLIINNAIIHELVKHKGDQEANKNIRNDVLDIENERVKMLIEGVLKTYGKKGNSAQYGKFKGETENNVPNEFLRYHELQDKTADNFHALTLHIMTALVDYAEGQQASTGGYIIFIDYSDRTNRYFVTAMIKQKPGITINDQLTIEQLEHIELSKLTQASRINFTRFYDFLTETDQAIKNEINYLSFVSQVSGRDASGYFVDALGCQKGISNNKITTVLINKSETFFKQYTDLERNANKFNNKLLHFLQNKVENKSPVKLSEITNLASSFFPDDERIKEHYENEFHQFLNNEQNRIPTEFTVNNTALKHFTKVIHKTKKWNITIDRHIIGDEPEADFYYNKEAQQLIISRIPPDLRAKLLNVIEHKLKID